MKGKGKKFLLHTYLKCTLISANAMPVQMTFQVNEATVDPDPYYYNQIIREEEEENWIPADSTLPEPASNTYKVSPTKSSKLRKQSARRRIRTLESLPPPRRDELQTYAGQYLPKSRRSSAKPKKVLHQSEWQT